jgi:hypothetical protein
MTKLKIADRRAAFTLCSVRSIVTAIGLLMAIGDTHASADEFNQVDVDYAVNQAAIASIQDAENATFEVVRMKIPRDARHTGFACGSIVPTEGATSIGQYLSFQTQLDIEDGQLTASPVAAFTESVDDLLKLDICNK